MHKLDSINDYSHHFATINGIRMHYLSAGKIGAEVIVLLAGFPQSSYAWRKVIPLLSENYRVIAPDLPGQGDSDYPINGYDTDTVAVRINALLEHLNIHNIHLVGHDIGAWVAFSFANCFPDVVKTVSLLDAGIPGVTLADSLPVTLEKAYKTWHFAFHMVQDLPESLIAGREAVYLDWFLKKKAANPFIFEDKDMQEYLRILSKPGSLRAGMAFYRSVAESAAQNKKNQNDLLHVPLLAVSADQGSIPDMATPLRKFVQNVTGVTIGNCGHFIPEEQPELLVQHMLDFIGAYRFGLEN
ncbi:MAG: alpha/beta hydrolase [Acinetobacter populi]|jgi:microsomal epoxide hydrolase|uniref:alpha/beta fold hydrolase n=1 Tax=Acinetobacter populi TaxID=1582270 RepID=UPI002354CF43|nr:alpha/beta hydrolase [Acinetobacter populi]MCH4246787.1 alpha/beta hydrolase [Acinetobacter populi]